ncbi:MAG: hypothetical protein HOI66_11900 [Verrucomicrobia bacterium]|jgi:hypothetical protein|nr:hypothetical protein [Verrucomicrobiota bacterium]
MNDKIRLTTLLAFTVSTFLVGCGSDESASTEPTSVTQEVAAPTAAKKKTTAKKKKTRSVMDQIDDALDRGDYMAAVNIAIKSGKTASENMSNLRYVQDELGDPMAQGEAKAHDAYKKLNAFYIMQHQR